MVHFAPDTGESGPRLSSTSIQAKLLILIAIVETGSLMLP